MAAAGKLVATGWWRWPGWGGCTGGRGPDRRAIRAAMGHDPAGPVPAVRAQRGFPDPAAGAAGPPTWMSPARRARPCGGAWRTSSGSRWPSRPSGSRARPGPPAADHSQGRPTQLALRQALARSRLRADRWYRLAGSCSTGASRTKAVEHRAALSSRRTMPYGLCRDAGLPTPRPYGVISSPRSRNTCWCRVLRRRGRAGRGRGQRPGDR